ncbi:MAG: acetate/propionate family kinase [Betaproteobacteria bacterium]
MTDSILVLNAGSSSIKFALYARADDGTDNDLRLELSGAIDGLQAHPHFRALDRIGNVIAQNQWSDAQALDHDSAIAYLIEFLRSQLTGRRVAAVGHRVVHGGMEFSGPVRVDAAILAKLEALVPLAPLHQPHNLLPIKLWLDREPTVPQIACFDTAFHHAQPALARAVALPLSITDRGVQRYGFHGLSYEYIAASLHQFDPKLADARVVVMHLGNGASMCAMRAGNSVATTMGFTALDGLPMGTRSGSLDPGVLLYLMQELKMDARAIETLLYEQSGLLGVSGISGDIRELEASRDPRARAAIDLFTYRINRELGSLTAALGGLDAIVFTAGIGENSALVRRLVCAHARWLGVALDAAANEKHGPRISADRSAIAVWVIPTDESLMIARHTVSVIERLAPP